MPERVTARDRLLERIEDRRRADHWQAEELIGPAGPDVSPEDAVRLAFDEPPARPAAPMAGIY